MTLLQWRHGWLSLISFWESASWDLKFLETDAVGKIALTDFWRLNGIVIFWNTRVYGVSLWWKHSGSWIWGNDWTCSISLIAISRTIFWKCSLSNLELWRAHTWGLFKICKKLEWLVFEEWVILIWGCKTISVKVAVGMALFFFIFPNEHSSFIFTLASLSYQGKCSLMRTLFCLVMALKCTRINANDFPLT